MTRIITYINAITNVLLSLIKLIIGLLFSSTVLVADGIHSLSDLLTDLFAAMGISIANHEVDETHPFGYGRAEYVFNGGSAMIILTMAGFLINDFIVNFSNLTTEVNSVVVWVAIVVFIIKILLSKYTMRKGKKLKSSTLINSATESKGDAVTTLVMIIGILMTVYGINNDIQWMVYAEKFATLYIIFILLKISITIFSRAIIEVSGTYADQHVKKEYAYVIEKFNPNIKVNNLMIIKEGINNNVILNVSKDNFGSLEEYVSYCTKIRQSISIQLANTSQIQININ